MTRGSPYYHMIESISNHYAFMERDVVAAIKVVQLRFSTKFPITEGSVRMICEASFDTGYIGVESFVLYMADVFDGIER